MNFYKQRLLSVLYEARGLVSLPGNDFVWSSWEDAEAAVRELDYWIEALQSEKEINPGNMEILFAPTGPMQEVSLSSGWGNAFLKLADRFDAAASKFSP